LQRLAMQSGTQILFRPELADGRRVAALLGRMPLRRALDRLLAGTGLTYRGTDAGVILIERDALAPAVRERLVLQRGAPAGRSPDQAIVVTAQRDAEAVRLSGDVRLRPREISIPALAAETPGLTAEPAGSGQQALLVRGVGMAGEATTLVYFAGVPISGPSGTGSDGARTSSDIALVDVRRIRISRTSRGSEHGAGSLAGEIEIEPEEPRIGHWEGRAGAGVSVQQDGEAGWSLSSTLNVPLGPAAALRVTAYGSREGGYIDNVRTGARNVNDDAMSGARVIARLTPTPELDLSLLAAWQRRRIGDVASWFRALGPYRTDRYFAAPTEHDFRLARLNLTYGGGPVRLTSITAAYRWALDRRYDRTSATLLQADDPAGCQRYFALSETACDARQTRDYASHVAGLSPSLLHIPILSRRVMQEVRLGNEATTGLIWVAGLLADHRTEKLSSRLSALDDGTVFGDRRLAIRRDQQAVFGTLSYRDPGGMLLSAGVRYDRFRVATRNDVVVPNLLSGSIASWPLTVRRSDGISGRLHVDVPIVPGVAWHTQLTRSFRPGGVNTASVLLPDRLTFDGDSLWGVELGIAAHWGRAVDLTLTGYMNDWRDMQVRALSENRSHAYLVNIGNAHIRGVEAELVVRPTPRLTLRSEASLIRARLSRVSDARLLVGGADAGDAVPFVPERRMRAAVEQEWPLGEGRALRVEGDWQYQSGSASTFSRLDPDFIATKGFSLFGARLSHRSGGSEFAVQVRNMFDRVANLRAVTNGYGVAQTFSYGPRLFLLSWSRRW
jgi:outer membrane receptor protein involved in Fe transport